MGRNLVTPFNIPNEFWNMLNRMGIPKHATSITIRIKPNENVEIQCTHLLEEPEGGFKVDNDKLMEIETRFRLVEVMDENENVR